MRWLRSLFCGTADVCVCMYIHVYVGILCCLVGNCYGGLAASSFLMDGRGICMHACMCMHVCMYVCLHVCVSLCMYVSMHVCMHVSANVTPL